MTFLRAQYHPVVAMHLIWNMISARVQHSLDLYQSPRLHPAV